ncbi:MAG: TonB-dependent receptor [Tannerella sp.]|nr:TonB-dependent receptor [Tannerella sp.]
MKQALFLLTICLSSVFADEASSQLVRVNLALTDVDATTLLDEIEDQTDFLFFYNSQEIDLSWKVTINAENVTVAEVLTNTFANTGIVYALEGMNIMLMKRTLGAANVLLHQQGNRIMGVVRDAAGEPVAGASIREKGTSNGTATDADGRFYLTVADNAILQISYLGYKSLEISALDGGGKPLEITLLEDSQALDEVVVVGYGTQSKRNVTSAISSIKSEAIVRSNATMLSRALAGKVQGVSTRTTDGRPGRAATIQIRNMGTPLYVIDGVPYGGSSSLASTGSPVFGGETSFNALSIEDVESISILKDASASIYGLRAANGVVLVTTKKGRKDEKVHVNLNGYYGWQNFTRFPTPANAGQYVRGIVESEQNQGRNPAALYTPEELAKWESGTDPDHKWYNWYDIAMRPNVPQYYINANISGGTQKMNYYVSLSRTDQGSIIKDNKWNKTNLQANVESHLMDGLTIGTQISGILDNTYNVGVPGWDKYGRPMNSTLRMWPIEAPYANDNPNYLNNTHVLDHNAGLYYRDVAGYADWFQKNANVNIYVQYDFKFGLSAKATYAYNYEHISYDSKSYRVNSYSYNKTTGTYEKQGNVISQWAGFEQRDVTSTYAQFHLNYKKTIADHNIEAVVAAERTSYENLYYMATANPSSNYISIVPFSELSGLTNEWGYEARAGYIGRLNYNYKDRYLVELLGRYDGSYLYVPEKRWGFFPGVSLGWRFSDEDFFKNIKPIVNDAKLRVSWGQTGSESGVSMFGYMSGYNFGQGGSVLDGTYVTGIRDRGLPVTNLTWITNTSTDIGIDLAFLDRRLTTTADVFRRKRTGIPAARYDVVLPSEVGYTLPNENLNSDEIKGIEGIVTWMDTGELNYSVSANATLARGRTLETYKPRFSSSWNEYTSSAEGRWYSTTWAYHCIGQFQSVDEINNYPIDNDGQGNRTMLPGDLKYEDVNGDKVINSLDQRPIGYAQGATPFLTFGLNASFEYKGISLSLDFAGGTMQSLYRSGILRVPYNSDWNSPEYLLSDRWHQADPYDNSSQWIAGKYPAIRKGLSSHSNYWNSDFWLTNIRYLRLKTAELGYTLPSAISSKLMASQIRFYVNISNLFSLDNVAQYQIDPEISATNGMVYPQQRVAMLGFNLSF